MPQTYAPKSESELAEVIANGTTFNVMGHNSKSGLGRLTTTDNVLSLKSFSGVESYEPEELVLEAGAATPLQDIENLLSQRQQMLAFEPPHLSHLWGGKAAGSMGGLLATGLSGPRRIKSGGARDHILGLRGVTGRGEIFKGGARVVKNVTGYDMPKLLAGSFGTLAALTSVTFKVLPAPETEESIFLSGIDDVTAMKVMSEALQSSAEVSGAAHVPGKGTYLRLEGIAVSVKARRENLCAILKQRCEVLNEIASRGVWKRIRDCKAIVTDSTRALWRISVAPSEGAKVAAAIKDSSDMDYYFDWGGGLIWASLPASGDGGTKLVRSACTEGHATLFAAPNVLRQTVSVFQPQSPTLKSLTARVKSALDPSTKLNPGRMYEGV